MGGAGTSEQEQEKSSLLRSTKSIFHARTVSRMERAVREFLLFELPPWSRQRRGKRRKALGVRPVPLCFLLHTMQRRYFDSPFLKKKRI